MTMRFHRLSVGVVKIVCLITILSACTPPSAVLLPDEKVLKSHSIELSDMSKLPGPVIRLMSGDVLRITRDANEVDSNPLLVYTVRPDGYFSYPYAGNVLAMGRTIEEIEAEITDKLSSVYRQPKVTINVVSMPSNRVFVGGAVRAPGSFDLATVQTLEQAIISSGGVLIGADSRYVTLLRLNKDSQYEVYYANFSGLLKPDSKMRGIQLVRGDVVYVPKSGIGNAVDGVDIYVNQLLPFTRSLGLGFTYVLRQPNTTTNVVQ